MNMKFVLPRIFWIRCKWYIKKYCESTSLHGFHFITDSGTDFFQSLLWIILCSATSAFAVFLILMQWDRYQTHRILTSIGSIQYPLESVPFPGVTLCSSNIVFRERYLKFENILLDEGFSKHQIMDYFANLSSLVIYDKLADNADLKLYARIIQTLELSGFHTEDVMSQVAQTCSSLISNCRWRNESVNCTRIFRKIKTQSGFCCTLNLKENSSTTGVGAKLGLQFDVDVVEEEYISSIKPYFGLDVTLHERNIYPETKYLGIPVAMGTDVQIAVEPEVVLTTDEVRSMDVNIRECIFDDESQLEWNYVYSYSGCKRECELAKMRKNCKCIPYYYPIGEYDKICTLLDLRCMIEFEEKKFDEDDCKCLPSCTKFNYDYTVNAREVKTIIGYDDSIEGSRITIFFQENQCQMIERRANFTWDGLLAAIGGIVGLCLGGSVLSMIEFIYFLLRVIFCKFRGESGKPSENKVPKVSIPEKWKPQIYQSDFKNIPPSIRWK